MQRTKDMACNMGYVEGGSPQWDKLSEKGKAVVKYLTDHQVDGFYKEVGLMIDAISGEDISIFLKKSFGDFPGAALVPLHTKNGITYQLSEAFLVINMKKGVMNNGNSGNDFNPKKEDNRPATEAEVDAFIEKLKSSGKAGTALTFF